MEDLTLRCIELEQLLADERNRGDALLRELNTETARLNEAELVVERLIADTISLRMSEASPC